MSLQEVLFLLNKYQIKPNKILGQNFMVDPSIFAKLAAYAEISSKDIVLDAGAGFGFLTRFLASKCKRVIAVEKDPAVTDVLTQQTQELCKITIVEGDILKIDVPLFNKSVSIPPYYISSSLIMWLLDRGFESAVLIVQKEFADRLVAHVGIEEYGWLAVVAQQNAQTELLDMVPKSMFYPEPQVDSIIIRLKPWQTPPFTVKDVALFRRLTKWLFTQRNKKVGNALAPFIRSELKLEKTEAQKIALTLAKDSRRARELAPQDFGAIADELAK
jgi:16S rRNA (adenine1518-N6/adenine1519-N6)-dimethyltransferase